MSITTISLIFSSLLLYFVAIKNEINNHKDINELLNSLEKSIDRELILSEQKLRIIQIIKSGKETKELAVITLDKIEKELI